MITPSTMARIERRNYLIGGALVLLSLLAGSQRFSLGVAVGVAITCANFAFLSRVLGQASDDVANKRMLWLFPKMLALMAITIGALLLIPMSPVGFGIGYMVFAVSIVADVFLAPAAPTAPSPDPNQPPTT